MKHKHRWILAATVAFLLTTIVSCSKPTDDNKKYGNAPRTNPMPGTLATGWIATTSGGGYLYNGYRYGNSGKGVQITMKENGTGWWNEVEMVATPGCVLSTNLSIDCTFELHNEGGRQQVYVYVTGGTYKGESCTSTTNKTLGANETYPKFGAMIYDYQITTASDNPAQQLLLLTQQTDAAKRFVAGVDDKLIVLKKQ
jgi:hypothetical protein